MVEFWWQTPPGCRLWTSPVPSHSREKQQALAALIGALMWHMRDSPYVLLWTEASLPNALTVGSRVSVHECVGGDTAIQFMTVDYFICNLNHFPYCSYFCHISQMKNWGFVRVNDIIYIGSPWGNLIKLILISANHSVCPLPPCIIINISWLFFVCVCVSGWSFFP